MITINQEQIKELEAFINTIPTAYGLPLLQFLDPPTLPPINLVYSISTIFNKMSLYLELG